MGLKLTVLGCDGSYPGPGGAASGYLVEGGGTNVWLDAGSGTLANLQRHVRLEEVDAVVLTHEHHDHWTDVYGFHIASTYVLERVGIPVYAPADLAAFLETRRPTLDPRPVADGDHVQVGALRLTFSRTDHPVETLAVRVDGGGKALGYSADSGPGWSIRTLGSDIDLALCEASFLLDREGSVQHLSARQAGTMARAAEVGQLVLTHVMPTVDVDAVRTEGVEAFGGPVEIAAIDAVYEV